MDAYASKAIPGDIDNCSTDKPNNNNNNLGAACFRCRGFRHACDRQKPTCSRCKKRGITCTYPEAAPTLKKLQKATETLGDRIRKFGDRLKSAEGMPKEFKAISLQRLAQPNRQSSVTCSEVDTPTSTSEISDTKSSVSLTSDSTSGQDESLASFLRRNSNTASVTSTSSFSVYPCSRCFKDLQQCDLTMPKCSRCETNDFECTYLKTEPKASHVSQVLTTMNKVMDQWQESIDRMAKDFAQKTRDFSQRANNSFKRKPLPPFAWKITSTGRGLSVESSVNSYNDLSKLVDQFKRTMHISPPAAESDEEGADRASSYTDERQRIVQSIELDDTSSIHTSSGFSFAVWNSLSQPAHALPQDYPIDISDELTDSLVELYCRSPCCSAIRLPIIDSTEFLGRYRDAFNKPSATLIYAVCAMAARNAFQVHVWNKRPANESPQYNMGKALSIAYCLKGREMLAECFDEATLDNCKAAILLSYCTTQNGYAGVNYIYEWIAYNMARELGLYDIEHVFTEEESKVVWCLYYFNAWYRVLEGGSSASIESSQFEPCCPLPLPPPKPEKELMDAECTTSEELVKYYIWSAWYYMIRLQLLRHDVMSRLVAEQSAEAKSDLNLPFDLLEMQDRLQEFYDELPDEWRSPDLAAMSSHGHDGNGLSPAESACSDYPYEDNHYHTSIRSLATSCILNVNIYYNINKILLFQVFVPSDHIPRVPFSVQSLYTCIDAAYTITQILDIMSHKPDECNVPLLAFLFANIVYIKLFNYQDEKCREFARRCLQLSVDISKQSMTYIYDFERAKTLVDVMENDYRALCGFVHPSYLPLPSTKLSRRASSIDSSSDGWSVRSSSSMPSSSYLSHVGSTPSYMPSNSASLLPEFK
ncbi:hypothetical protein BX666DRAFT_1113638 [Dichotomocladium elegans]|nr:hypothetical protein BX666DRAFT_1113638 [Dichotomocladium elegans]